MKQEQNRKAGQSQVFKRTPESEQNKDPGNPWIPKLLSGKFGTKN